jgi:hypothetical protein
LSGSTARGKLKRRGNSQESIRQQRLEIDGPIESVVQELGSSRRAARVSADWLERLAKISILKTD